MCLDGLHGKAQTRDARANARSSGGSRPLRSLTARGLALDPVITELGRWGWPLMDKPRRGELVDLWLG